MDVDSPEWFGHYDYIVVGAGAAGCVLASRLTEDPDCEVLLIEAGRSSKGVSAIREARRWVELLNGPWDWGHRYLASPDAAGRAIPIPRGRVIGGSSSTNAMMWYRGHPDDYDAWVEAGARGWGYSEMLPYFRRSEDWEGGETPLRGAGGPMRIERPRDPHPIAAAMVEGMAELGHAVLDDMNGPCNEGAAFSNFNQTVEEDGMVTRWSTVRGYLAPALDRANLSVLTEATVDRVLFEGGRAAVVTWLAGARRQARARAGVIVSLGALETPAFLVRSGIGAPENLARLGIEVVSALRGVGQNFQDHPLLMGLNFLAREPLGPVRDNGGGSMMNWRSSVADHRPDLHAFVVQGLHAGPEVARRYGLDGWASGPDNRVFAISPGLMRSQAVGTLTVVSSDPFARPVIDPAYLRHPDDLAALVESVGFVQKLAQTAPYRSLIDRPLTPPGSLTRAETEEYVRLAVDTFFHCSGTAKIGGDDDPMTVVDSDLRVRGVEGLWVADASVIPVIPTCNTQAPVIAIAEKAAELIPASVG